MNSVFEYLCLRKPRLDYVSPPICCDFSASGFPVIVLDPLGRLVSPTGFILSGEGNLTLSWDIYQGALCYNIYQAVDENNPEGEYVLIAECIEANSFQLPEPGFYRVSAITENGESELSTPINATHGGGGCQPTIQLVALSPISAFRSALAANSGVVIGGFSGGSRPGYFFNGITKDTRDSVNSAPVQASQTGFIVTSDAPFFVPSHVGSILVFSTSEQAEIQSVDSNVQVTVVPSQSVALTTFEIRGNTLGGAIGTGLVSNSSVVLGGTEQPFGGGAAHAFWLDTGANEIRSLGPDRVPFDINENGYLLLDDLTTALHRTIIYNSDVPSFTDIGLFEVGSQTTPVAFNDALVLAVNCTISGINTACRWAGGAFTNIAPAQTLGTQPSNCEAINSSGNIAGRYRDGTDFTFRGFINTGGASTLLGDLGGEVNVKDMNDTNVVVGNAELGSEFVPFLWTSITGILAIPLLPGHANGSAEAVNNLGWVVGDMSDSASTIQTAFIHRNGITTALIDLAPPGSGWTELFTADFVNNNKQIVGFGSHTTFGGNVGYILTLC